MKRRPPAALAALFRRPALSLRPLRAPGDGRQKLGLPRRANLREKSNRDGVAKHGHGATQKSLSAVELDAFHSQNGPDLNTFEKAIVASILGDLGGPRQVPQLSALANTDVVQSGWVEIYTPLINIDGKK
ncbi:hypothetical protein NDU88_001953 [Pleurodeles waltl]|uniref:Uncharacterized protein n=1 Tax=Pleurodeles waltl TaxID=8319 RepID=A0AAV7R8L0_PLEWA|nr:hypothetical protein NDU88_001953 [Pleurodeles waltl]